jgi:hypothetical protein
MLESKKRWFLILIRLLGSTLLIYFGFKEFSATFGKNELNLVKPLFSGFIGSIGVFNLVLLLISYEIQVTEKELIKKSFFGFYKKKISRNRITGFTEFHFNSESLYTKSLFLLGDNINIEISSTEISNYEEVKSELIKGLNEDKIYKGNFEKHLNGAGIIILIFVLVVVFGYKIFGS